MMSKKAYRATLALLPIALCASGCATVTSQSIDTAQPTRSGENDGIAYFLPRQLAKVTVTRSNTKVESAIEALAKAKTRLAAAEASLLVEDQKVQAARDKLRTAETPEGVRLAQEELFDARVGQKANAQAVADAQTAFNTAATALDTAATNAQSDSPNDAKVMVGISLLEPTADPSFGYRLNPRHMALRDDTDKFVIGSNGLLKTSNITATDRTVDVLTELGKLAGALTGIPARADGDPRSEGSNAFCAGAPKSYTEVIDFAAEDAVKLLNDRLFCLGARVDVDRRGAWLDATRPIGEQNAAAGSVDGIVYRTPVEVTVTILKRVPLVEDVKWGPGSPLELLNEDLGKRREVIGNLIDAIGLKERELKQATGASAPAAKIAALEEEIAAKKNDLRGLQTLLDEAQAFFDRSLAISYPEAGWIPVETIALKLPQAGPISVLRQNAGAFVKTDYDLVFDNGILTEYSSDRPSEVLALASAPLKVINGFFEGISQIISLRTGRANDLAGLSEAELTLLNARAAQERGVITNQRLLSTEELALANQLAAAEVAAVNNRTTLTAAQQTLLEKIIEQEYASEIQQLKQRRLLATASQDLAQTLSNAQNAAINNSNTILASQLALLGQQNTLAIAELGGPSALYKAQIDALISTQLTNELRACVERQIEAKQSIDVCLR